MIKRMICTECPVGCALTVDIELGRVLKVEGNKCPKGEKYAISEIESPVRVLTSSVLTKGLSLKMLPVKTDKPIPKNKILEAMEVVKKVRVVKPVRVGDVVFENLLGLGVNLVATRDIVL